MHALPLSLYLSSWAVVYAPVQRADTLLLFLLYPFFLFVHDPVNGNQRKGRQLFGPGSQLLKGWGGGKGVSHFSLLTAKYLQAV
jgi:hypothetical protein